MHHAGCRSATGNAPGGLALDEIEAVLATGVKGADAVDHRIRAQHHRAHRCIIAHVTQNRLDLTTAP